MASFYPRSPVPLSSWTVSAFLQAVLYDSLSLSRLHSLPSSQSCRLPQFYSHLSALIPPSLQGLWLLVSPSLSKHCWYLQTHLRGPLLQKALPEALQTLSPIGLVAHPLMFPWYTLLLSTLFISSVAKTLPRSSDSKEYTCNVQSLGWEDPLENEMSTHSSILAWGIPWTEESSEI